LRNTGVRRGTENHLSAIVRVHYSLPPGKIGLAPQPEPRGDFRGELRMGPFAGLTEVLIPAGYVTTVYDPVFVLSPDKKRYIPTANNTPATLPVPGLQSERSGRDFSSAALRAKVMGIRSFRALTKWPATKSKRVFCRRRLSANPSAVSDESSSIVTNAA
jgi:hypothetical protein